MCARRMLGRSWHIEGTHARERLRIEEREPEAGGLKLAPSLPLQGDDPNEERDDDGHRDSLWQPVGTCDREKDEARDDHE